MFNKGRLRGLHLIMPIGGQFSVKVKWKYPQKSELNAINSITKNIINATRILSLITLVLVHCLYLSFTITIYCIIKVNNKMTNTVVIEYLSNKLFS